MYQTNPKFYQTHNSHHLKLPNLRPCIIFIGREDGTLDVWDLFDNLGQASHPYPVSALGIQAIEMDADKPRLVTAGDKDGCLHLLSLPSNLFTTSHGEKEFFQNFIEKEKERVSYYHNKIKTLAREKHEKESRKQQQNFFQKVDL